MSFTLRPYQEYFKSEFFKAVEEGHKNICIGLQTGGGKTFLSASIAEEYLNNDDIIIFIAPRINLVYQTVKSFNHLGNVQVIQGKSKYSEDESVYIASLQTLIRRDLPFRPALIIIDESHAGHTGKSQKKLREKYSDSIFLCLTATPFDSKGWPLKGFDKIIKYKTIRWYINNGYLCDCECFAPVLPDLSKINTTGDDYNKGELDTIMNNDVMIGNIIEETKDMIAGEKTLFFAVTIAHAEAVAAQYNAVGIKAIAYHSKMEDDAREKAIEDFSAGKVDLLVSVTALVMGFDVPSVTCLIIARPTKSQSFFRQLIGRGMRVFPGKEFCLLIDCAGTIKENGFPNQEVIPKVKKAKSSLEMKCFKCNNKAKPISKSVRKINGVLNYITTWACKKNHTFETQIEVSGTLCPSCSKMITPGNSKFKESDDEYIVYAVCDCGEEITIRSIPKVNGKIEKIEADRETKFWLVKEINKSTDSDLVKKFCKYVLEVIHPKMQHKCLSSIYVSIEMRLNDNETKNALMETIVNAALEENEYACLSTTLLKKAYNDAKDPSNILHIHNSRAVHPMNKSWLTKTVNALREFEENFPDSKSWLLKSIKTRCQNISQKSQKMSSIFYFFEFLTKKELAKQDNNEYNQK